MSAFSLVFRVDAPDVPGDETPALFSPASAALRRDLSRELGVKLQSVAWLKVILGTPKADRALHTLAGLRTEGIGVVGSATLTEELDADDTARADWFLLSTRTVDEFNLWDDYPGCRAGSLPKVHALNHTFVSQAFVEVCARRSLTGVTFLRCANRGRKGAKPWFAALPAQSLGRGLDHPWFDRARWLRDVADWPGRRSSALDVGQSAFHQCWLSDAAANDPCLRPVLEVCPAPAAFQSGIEGLQIVTIPHYWTGAMPPHDFAHLPWGEDGPNREGKIMRFRMLAVRARAREALMAEGLFDAKAFLALRSIDEPEPGVTMLDDRDNPVPAMCSESELMVLREKEARLPP